MELTWWNTAFQTNYILNYILNCQIRRYSFIRSGIFVVLNVIPRGNMCCMVLKSGREFGQLGDGNNASSQKILKVFHLDILCIHQKLKKTLWVDCKTLVNHSQETFFPLGWIKWRTHIIPYLAFFFALFLPQRTVRCIDLLQSMVSSGVRKTESKC